MSSDAQTQNAPPAPAAAGGSKMGLIAIVVVVVVVAAVIGAMFLMGGSDDGLTGKWTVSGGEIKMTVVQNNDTANTTYMNITIPASTEVIDFDDAASMPAGMSYKDLGDGKFEIENFDMSGTDFGKIEGTYNIEGDTMTITMTGTTYEMEMGDYMEFGFDYTMNLKKA